MEDYNTPQRTLHVTLFRNFLLEAVIVGVLVYFWLQKAHSEVYSKSKFNNGKYSQKPRFIAVLGNINWSRNLSVDPDGFHYFYSRYICRPSLPRVIESVRYYDSTIGM